MWLLLLLVAGAGACVLDSDCTNANVSCGQPYCNAGVCALRPLNASCDNGDPCFANTCNTSSACWISSGGSGPCDACAHVYTSGCLPPALLACNTPPSGAAGLKSTPLLLLLFIVLSVVLSHASCNRNDR
jgi:hypothetical protein